MEVAANGPAYAPVTSPQRKSILALANLPTMQCIIGSCAEATSERLPWCVVYCAVPPRTAKVGAGTPGLATLTLVEADKPRKLVAWSVTVKWPPRGMVSEGAAAECIPSPPRAAFTPSSTAVRFRIPTPPPPPPPPLAVTNHW